MFAVYSIAAALSQRCYTGLFSLFSTLSAMNVPCVPSGNSSLQLYPLLRVALFLLAGILIGSTLWRHVPFYAWMTSFGVTLFAALLARHRPVMQTVFILLATLFVGCMLISRSEQRLLVHFTDAPTVYEAVLLSEPVQRGKVVQFDLFIASGYLTGHKVKASLLRDTVQNRYRRLHLGDGIRAFSVVEQPRQFTASRFNWPQYLHTHGFVGTTFIYYANWQKATVSLNTMSHWQRVRLRAQLFRQSLLHRYRATGLNDESFTLLAAMTLGEKKVLSKSLRDVYQRTGVSHILALSGMHLGIIYMLLTLLLPRRRYEVLRQVVLLAAIWAYVIMVGMAPSLMRAAMMITVYALTHLLNRSGQPLNTLSLAAIILMVADPQCVYDIGFQLSFMAVLFILLFFNPVYRLFPERRTTRFWPLRWLWSLVVISLVAHAGTAPLVMHHFGTFSLYFLPANLIAVPLATVLITGMLLLLVLFPFAALQGWLAQTLSTLITWQTSALSAIASWPGAIIENIHLSVMQTWMLYAMMFLLAAIVIILQRGRVRIRK